MGPVLAIIANILREATFPVAYSDCDDGSRRSRPKLRTQRSVTQFAKDSRS
jgi:hypothetical protein